LEGEDETLIIFYMNHGDRIQVAHDIFIGGLSIYNDES
jgi:hypothetical protein